MGLDRRKFLKCIGAGMAMAFVPLIPKIPKIPIEDKKIPEIPEPEPLRQVKTVDCPDFSPQVTIQDYSPGQTITYQDLRVDGDCEECMYENMCLTSGRRYEKYGDGGKFNPKAWNEKVNNKLMRSMAKDLA